MLLQAYHAQSGGTRFRVLSSELGYHFIPEQVHDEAGHLVPAHSVLDARITVPTETRTPRQHLLALLNAVTTANTVKVSPVIAGKPTGFDTIFRATPAQFPWGADGVVARDALIDLLKRSSTTMIWHLLCQPSAKAEDRACGLNMSMLEVTVTDPHGIPANRVLRFDRCGDCPPLALPAAPPPAAKVDVDGAFVPQLRCLDLIGVAIAHLSYLSLPRRCRSTPKGRRRAERLPVVWEQFGDSTSPRRSRSQIPSASSSAYLIDEARQAFGQPVTLDVAAVTF